VIGRARTHRGPVIVALVASLQACASTATPLPDPTGAPTAATAAPTSATASPATASPSVVPTAAETLAPTAAGTLPTPAPASPEQPSGAVGTPALDRLRVSFTPFVDGLDSPVFLTHAGDGSGVLYIVEQGGRILTVEASGAAGDAPFLDIAERIQSGGEQGLLGLAFHPDYPTDDRFFVMYTASSGGANTIAEFRAPDGVGDPASERVLLAVEDFAGNHNGGMVAFGADGYLYAGTGDGGGGGDPQRNGQDPGALLGKILRIDIDSGDPYGSPADNPGASGGELAPEVWALGLRNPWRFSFDRLTGDLWIGDVGQGAWEEIDAQPAGAGGRNYGWNLMEGPDCFGGGDCDMEGLTLPVAAYGRGEGACVVIGGYVYRGDSEPEAHGTYLYADVCTGQFWGLDAAAALRDGSAQPVELVVGEPGLSSFGEDEAGELYAVGLGGSVASLELTTAD
jgi:glucose/arabinose dehydrogenase